jgi:radical SAM superfamily enzyme YgiQ (UPF0313 family)
MNLALIDPRFSLANRNLRMREYLSRSPQIYFYSRLWSGFSTGLLTLAALSPVNTQITYVDENHEPIPFDREFDVVAVTATTQQATRAYQIADRFRRHWGKRTLLVAGGPHVSFLPEEAEKHFDVVFMGEAEKTWPEFLADLRSGRPRSRYDSSDQPRPDLKTVPIPRYDLLTPQHYKMLWLQTSRGCPRRCEFCAASSYLGTRYRTKTIDQVLREIHEARKYLRLQPIFFADDNMLLGSRYSRDFIRELASLRISYVAQTDIGIAERPGLLEALRASGCSTLFIGFESLDQRNLALMNPDGWKAERLPGYVQKIRRIREAGIAIYGAFIVGYDWDTPESFRGLGEFITENLLAGAQITFATPLPGTALRERMLREGRILDTPWENYTFFDVNFSHATLSTEQLEAELLKLYETVYSEEYLARKNWYYRQVYLKEAR